jgi:hemerythrin-like metal-binding protein
MDMREFSLDIGPIDLQHKQLIKTCEDLREIDSSNINEQLKLLKLLYSYTNYHFASEENLFLRFGYPQTDLHVKIHKDFTKKIKTMFESVKSGMELDLRNANEFLEHWIQNHILGEDRKYAQFFDSQGIKISDSYFFSNDGADEDDSASLESSVNALFEQRSLSLNIQKIDSQHRELVFLLQQTNDLNVRGISLKRKMLFLPTIIKKMYYYSQFHFQTEEGLMEEKGYDRLAEHKEQHKKFVFKVGQFARDYHQRKADLSEEIVDFLHNWTISHIIKDDGAFKKFLTS